MNFLADMGISPNAVRYLRTIGHDAVHLQELGLDRLPDGDILAKAAAERRVLLIHDLDFADLLAMSRATLPSVILFRLTDMRPAAVNRQMDYILAHYIADLERGAILAFLIGESGFVTCLSPVPAPDIQSGAGYRTLTPN